MSAMKPKNELKFLVISILLLIIVICIQPTKAKDSGSLEVTKGITTNHVDSFEGYNEDNGMTVIEYDLPDSDWGVLVTKFNNSYYTDTIAIAGVYSVYEYKQFEVNVISGLMKGYTAEDIGNELCPLKGKASDICWFLAPRVLLSVYENKDYAVKASVLLFGTAIVTTVGLEYKF